MTDCVLFMTPFQLYSLSKRAIKNRVTGTSLVVQWLRIYLPTEVTEVRSLVREDSTFCEATKPVCHNY